MAQGAGGGFDKGLDDPARWADDGTPLKTAAQVIIDEAKTGLPAEIAAQLAGISLRTYRNWLTDGRAVLARIAAQPDIELSAAELRLAQFTTDVEAARAEWVSGANQTLEKGRLSRQKVTVRTKKATALVDGVLIEYDAEVTTTVEDLPVELGPLQWRLSKLAPAQYGPVTRLELTGADGGPVELDIGARVAELLGRIRGSIAVEGEEQDLGPGEPELLSLEPGEPVVES